MSFISKEVPSGDIDGVNKVFTTANTIYQLDDIFIGGAIYTQFSYSGKTITLQDAPDTGWTIFVDYWDAQPTGTGGGITVSDAIARIKQQKKSQIPEVSNDLWFKFLDPLNFMVYEALYALEPNKYIKTNTYSVLDGTAAYSDPSDLKSLRVDVAGYFDTNTDGTRKYPILRETRIDSTEYGYTRRGGQVYFTPAPTADRTVLLDYIPRLAHISAVTDILILSSEQLDAVLHFLMMKYGDWNLDVATQIANDQMFARDLANYLQNAAVEPQIFIL